MKGFIYLICDPNQNTYKIGVTRNLVQHIIKKLQTGNSSELHIVHTFGPVDYPFRLETLLHTRFKEQKVIGEWYALSDDDVKNFDNICKHYLNIIDSMTQNPYFNKNLK